MILTERSFRSRTNTDEDYYHGVQSPPKAIETLRRRRQPIITFNRTGRKIDQMVGLLVRLRQDPEGLRDKIYRMLTVQRLQRNACETRSPSLLLYRTWQVIILCRSATANLIFLR